MWCIGINLAFAACSITGGACAISDLISTENNTKKQTETQKQNLKTFKNNKPNVKQKNNSKSPSIYQNSQTKKGKN
jgi:hypothetical protein